VIKLSTSPKSSNEEDQELGQDHVSYVALYTVPLTSNVIPSLIVVPLVHSGAYMYSFSDLATDEVGVPTAESIASKSIPLSSSIYHENTPLQLISTQISVIYLTLAGAV